MTDIASIHDKFLRAILADREVARDYFRSCLPLQVADLMDFSTLTQLSDSYVSKALRQTFSDVVYACQTKDHTTQVRISLLLEHKSKPDKFTPVQLLSYIASGHLRQIAQDRQLAPIIPILLYHGSQPWKYRTLVTLFKALKEELRPFVPDYDYVYHDLGEIPDEDLMRLENKFLQASLLALKYSQLKKELVAWIPTILSLAMTTQQTLQSNLIIYTFGVSGLSEQEIGRIIEDVPVNLKTNVMNTLDIFVEKGKKIGLEEGRLEGRLEGITKGRLEKTEKAVRNMISEGFPAEMISKILEVSPEFVERIREELTGK